MHSKAKWMINEVFWIPFKNNFSWICLIFASPYDKESWKITKLWSTQTFVSLWIFGRFQKVILFGKEKSHSIDFCIIHIGTSDTVHYLSLRTLLRWKWGEFDIRSRGSHPISFDISLVDLFYIQSHTPTRCPHIAMRRTPFIREIRCKYAKIRQNRQKQPEIANGRINSCLYHHL